MAYTEKQIRELFQSKFDVSTWTDFIINFFKATHVNRVPEPLDINPEEGMGYYWGRLSTNDLYEISFFYLKMNRSIDQRKVGLRQLVKPYIGQLGTDVAIAVFDDGIHWRLSFITDLRGEKTSPKRFTFVCGDSNGQYNTPVSRFMELQRKGISYENIKVAFSVEALTKQFYNDLFKWYLWALKKDTGVYFPNSQFSKDGTSKQLETKLIRLITRLMFVWFIKQKKDDKGKGLVPEGLFDPEELKLYLKDFDPQSMTSSNYYQAILQNLFFATLNRPIRTITYDKDGNEQVERRCFAKMKDKPDVKSKYRYPELFKISEDRILGLFEHIPFINGGLFECLDKNRNSDGVDQAYFDDGFTRNTTIVDGRYKNRAFVPNRLFFAEDGIISIFRKYNFTVEENSPSEQQIALDPELLGKVFENLLGAYNPETHDQATDRKRSGSFYTPREIVNFMVDTALQSYLGNTEDIKSLFKDDFEYDNSKKEFYENTINKLKAIKVFDPACGSGAFPMGMLNRIMELLHNLKAPGNNYDLKLQIMENCIYGGDIQTIAAQITKLRFFISLVCDCEKTDNPDDNYGIPNLPNLETHFVTCDSLIGLKKPQQYSLFEQDVIQLKKKLQEVRHEHFVAKTVYQKTKLRNRDKELRDELALMLSDDNVIASDDARQMAAWNPYDQNCVSTFFDPEWMFGIKDGFDIVIGNPPYIEAKKLKGKADKLKNYDVYSGSADYSIYFVEKGLKLCKDNGIVYYITTNKFFNTGYGKNLKQLILKKEIRHLVNFEQVEVFENVLVSSVVLGICNSSPREANNIAFKQYKKLKHKEFKKQFDGKLKSTDVYPQDMLDEKEWSFADRTHLLLKEKIETLIIRGKSAGKRLLLSKVPGIAIHRGITTGFNPAFIIDDGQRKRLIKDNPQNEIIIKHMLQGRNIRKWYYTESDEYLLQTGFDIDIKNNYPTIYEHMFQFKKELSERADQGRNWWNLRACKYYSSFEETEKIVWGLTADKWAFTLDTKCHYLPSNGYILTSSKIPIKYVLGLLNSDLLKYYFTFIGVMTAGGAFTLKDTTISALPFCTTEDMEPIIKVVDEILKKKSTDSDADVSFEESQLNDMVYKLYDIKPDEQKQIRHKLDIF